MATIAEWNLSAREQARRVVERKADISRKADLNLKTMGDLSPESAVHDYKQCPEHIATLHGPDKPPWPCGLCSEQDSPRSNLQQHQQQRHLSREQGQFGSKGESNGADVGKEAGAGAGVENEKFVSEFDRESEEARTEWKLVRGWRGGREQRGPKTFALML